MASLSLRWRSHACWLGVLVLIALLASSCLSREKRLTRAWKKNPSFRIAYWGTGWKSLPLAQRISAAPAELVEKILVENKIQGFDEHPEPAPPLPEVTAALESIEWSLPPAVRGLLEDRLVGVFCVRDLGGTGYADVVYDREEQESFGLIVLDMDVLRQRSANDWATWKERGFFQAPAEGEPNVEVRIEPPENDTVENAVRFILLHEIGHVLGMVSRAHASWVDWQEGKPVPMDAPFVQLSWRPDSEDVFRSRFDGVFPQRRHVRAYGFDRSDLTAAQMTGTYRALAQHTNFPTLPAAQSPWEDFAESFATYIHVGLDGRPRTATVMRDQKPVLHVATRWEDSRLTDKRRFMKAWATRPFEPLGP